MDLNRKIKEMEQLKKRIEDLQGRVLPVKAGNLAVNHFKENFRQGGYRDESLTPWQITKRQQAGGQDAASQYGPLLSGRNHLMNSIRYVPEDGRVTILNDLIYARIHNEGGTVTHAVTPKMRKFAWARYFKSTGIGREDDKETKQQKEKNAGEEAINWKRLALTKKESIQHTIPQRQFMGKGKKITGKIFEMAEKELRKIFNK
jgi:phage gpG-like protein